ncbi:MAG TPA: thiamine-phosphate kinase [Acetobacteraceae bacterium]|nr:thiamine-phosphate kinase [Acetobacteraceae bacterium]
MSDLPREFALIARYFRPLAHKEALGLADDAALLSPPPGRELVLTVDAMLGGVHFLPDDPPDLVARKLLRVNLSDIAAKAATPLGYLLTIAAPHGTKDDWFAAFAAGLAEDQREFGIALLGGDTTATAGPLALSLTAIGTVEAGRAVLRQGAAAGHGIWVTGTIGDAALGLAVLRGELADPILDPASDPTLDPLGHFVQRYRLPVPRLGLRLADFAAAAMDISDGLVQDLGHLCRAGSVAAEIEAARVPLSASARAAGPAWRPDWLQRCLTGGDDYELLLAVPRAREPVLEKEAARTGLAVTNIGRFTLGAPGVTVRGADGAAMTFSRPGWSHF